MTGWWHSLRSLVHTTILYSSLIKCLILHLWYHVSYVEIMWIFSNTPTVQCMGCYCCHISKKKKNLNTELFMQIKSWYINLFFSRHIWRNFEAILTIILIVLQVAVVSNNLQHVSYRIYIVHQYKWHMYITYMYNIHKNI